MLTQPLPLDPLRLRAEGGAAAVASLQRECPNKLVVGRLQLHPPSQSDSGPAHTPEPGSRAGPSGSALWNSQRSNIGSKKTQKRKFGSEEASTTSASQGLNTPNPPRLLSHIKLQKIWMVAMVSFGLLSKVYLLNN